MAGMTKLILLMTLAAVAFLPQDGIKALTCTRESPVAKAINETCKEPGPDDPPSVCQTIATRNDDGTPYVERRCDADQKSKLDKKGCYESMPPSRPARICNCNTNLCNEKSVVAPPSASAQPPSGRLHGQSSVLTISLSIVTIFLAISFGKP